MKIIVFADSHTDIETMNIVINSEYPDMVIHLGDHVKDGEELQKQFQEILIELVKGNTDKTYNYPVEKMLTANDKAIFITHGDQYGVEEGLDDIIYEGINEGADIILFGHTHKPYLENQDGVWIMNPGRIGRKSSKHINATYGIIEVNDGNIDCKIIEFDAL